MSLDLSWSLLDEAFVSELHLKLNEVLDKASRPDYIGPISISNLTLGHEQPEISITNVGDVWEGFLQRDEASMAAAAVANPHSGRTRSNSGTATQHRVQTTAGEPHAVRRDGNLARFADKNLPFSNVRSDSPLLGIDGDDELAAVPSSRRRASRNRRLQTFRQYSDSGNMHRIETGSASSFDAYSSVPPSALATPSPWGAGLPHHASASANGGYFPAWAGGLTPHHSGPASVRSLPQSRRSSWQRQMSVPAAKSRQPSLLADRLSAMQVHSHWQPHPKILSPMSHPPEAEQEGKSSNSLPSLQLQLSVHWTSQSLRITLETSLLVNHPSPAFMSLPLTITITGLSLMSGGLLAFEVDPVTSARRVHFCLMVEEDEEDESQSQDNLRHLKSTDGDQSKSRLSPTAYMRQSGATHPLRRSSQSSIPATPFGGSTSIGADSQAAPGERILYNLNLETSVGQADKHVLKNVTKVERFVVSLVRKAIGDELVFPNFYSVEL